MISSIKLEQQNRLIQIKAEKERKKAERDAERDAERERKKAERERKKAERERKIIFNQTTGVSLFDKGESVKNIITQNTAGNTKFSSLKNIFKKPVKKENQIHLLLDNDDYKLLEELKKGMKISYSDIIRILIRNAKKIDIFNS